jgi:tRNA-splicing ligase RtcB
MENLTRLSDYKWQIDPEGAMLSPAIVYADEEILASMQKDSSLKQLTQVASLPGIKGPALAMPDAHQGYGFPIGGVAAFGQDDGIISPGGVGYDINCGVRLLRSRLKVADLDQAALTSLADSLFQMVPAGVGRGGRVLLTESDLDQVARTGAAWAVKQGFGKEADLEHCESRGALPGGDPEAVGGRARRRGASQLGTLGAGNHFVEIAQVDEVYDLQAAQVYGLEPGGIVIWLHSGSRGFGHQVCGDFLKLLARDPQAAKVPDRQLVAAPPGSKIGRAYLGAMAAAANYAFGNRQMLTHLVREAVSKALGTPLSYLSLSLVYDVAHNIVKLEKHLIPGTDQRAMVWVHRKGATRSLGPRHQEVPSQYQGVGQPVLLPGDMGRYSFVLKGTEKAEAETFGSAAHGAGRRLSRTAAKKKARGRSLVDELAKAGVLVRVHSMGTLAEEMPRAYKDASKVARVMHGSGIAELVVRTKPLVVIKG